MAVALLAESMDEMKLGEKPDTLAFNLFVKLIDEDMQPSGRGGSRSPTYKFHELQDVRLALNPPRDLFAKLPPTW